MSRSLGQLLASKDMLTGEEADRLRDYVNKAYLDLGRDLKEPYKALFEDGDLTAFQEHFEGRVRHFGGRRHEAAQELFKLRWGPTRVPVYTVLLEFATILPESRYKYIAIIEWLVDTAKVPVDGTDMSGTSALMSAMGTNPYFDTEVAQIMLDAGGDINKRDRFGGVTAHDITTVQLLYSRGAHERAGHALQWYLEHGGSLDIEDGDGMCARQVVEKLEKTDRTLKGIVEKYEEQKANGSLPSGAIARPTARNSPCPCGSGRKYKKCCGQE